MAKIIKDDLLKNLSKHFDFIDINKIPKEYEETINHLFDKEDNIRIDRERFNIILTSWRLNATGKGFFNYYFKLYKKDHVNSNQDNSNNVNNNSSDMVVIDNIENLKMGLNEFIKDALWYFGDLERAYNKLRDIEDLNVFFKQHKFNKDEIDERLEWTIPKNLTIDERFNLGQIISHKLLYEEDNIIKVIHHIVKNIVGNFDKYNGCYIKDIFGDIINDYPFNKKNEAIGKLLMEDNRIRDYKIGSSFVEDVKKIAWILSEKEQKEKLASLSKIIGTKNEEETEEKITELTKKGYENQNWYLKNAGMIDVYVATSMGKREDYKDVYNFVHEVFHGEGNPNNKLRYFDPTVCYCDSRVDNGLIECLLIRNSKVTLYCAQDGDTFGKDSELATTLAQGKPVIVYVPEIKKPKGKEEEDKAEILNKRALTFRDFHPLGLQIGLFDGVARGVIVVRNSERCAEILNKILNDSLEVILKFEKDGIVLREKVTESVLRVMTRRGQLAHIFWSNFKDIDHHKSGLPILTDIDKLSEG
jgi:hypothetical protein